MNLHELLSSVWQERRDNNMLPITVTQVFAIIAVLVLSASIAINLYRIAYRRARRAYRRRSLAHAPNAFRTGSRRVRPSTPTASEPPKLRETVIGIAAKI